MNGYFEDDGTYVSTSASKVFTKVQASLEEEWGGRWIDNNAGQVNLKRKIHWEQSMVFL